MVNKQKIAGVNKRNDQISLPKLYLKQKLPAEKEEVASPVKVLQQNCLDSIKLEIKQIDDTELEMLIEATCLMTLESNKILPSEDVSPLANQRKLAW